MTFRAGPGIRQRLVSSRRRWAIVGIFLGLTAAAFYLAAGSGFPGLWIFAGPPLLLLNLSLHFLGIKGGVASAAWPVWVATSFSSYYAFLFLLPCLHKTREGEPAQPCRNARGILRRMAPFAVHALLLIVLLMIGAYE